ncbi:MAG: hypothetical protein OXO49_08155 [Gammaproteobacteria bacterium]|nr:hypothetical protein [Gammaproteobacteria bacterium]MDE0251555.1 hypothetical protein [Gammaproteobacteria bacterium]MDE0403435.1 hypothetical protein [Gammaproteobacteria bacterium]
MTNLSFKELDVLDRIDKREQARRIFFQQVTGLKWFDALAEKGYFDPDKNPRPEETTDRGHVIVPYWYVLDYLEKTSQELKGAESSEFPKKFRELVISISKFAMNKQFSNYRTWWKFAEIISNIPSGYVSESDLDIVDYWLDDPYDTSLVGEVIGTQWLPRLLNQGDQHSQKLATRLVSLLFEVKRDAEAIFPIDSNAVSIRGKSFLCHKFIERVSTPLGRSLGAPVLPILENNIKSALELPESDKSSVIWRPAIENHEQNQDRDSSIHLLLDFFRDTLNAFVESQTTAGIEYVKHLLNSDFKTLRRIAIHAIDKNFNTCGKLFDTLLKPILWTKYHYKHELWNLLNHHYSDFTEKQKESIIHSINSLKSENNEILEQTRAYRQAEWLAAIREYGEKEEEAYRNCVQIAGTKPDHPSFEAYMQWGQVMPKSPISIEHLSAMQTSELIKYLNEFKASNTQFFESPIEGLFDTFREYIKSSALSFSRELSAFQYVELRYTYQIVEAYRELWEEKSSLPWRDIWEPLLRYCHTIVSDETFWDEKNAELVDVMIPNRRWVVGSIASLIESGVKTVDYAFESEFLDISENIVELILKRQEAGNFEKNDAVFNAINSPRGKSIKALVNLTLRRCRDADALNDKDHSEIWSRYQPIYDQELELSSPISYEVPTLFANYLPNLLYMSTDWVHANMGRIFSLKDPKWWRCAMEGYAYFTSFKKDVYLYLRNKGHLLKTLDDNTLPHLTHVRVIKNVCFAFCLEIESLETPTDLVSVLVNRNKTSELNMLVWEFWRIGKDNKDQLPKIKAFWRNVLSVIDLNNAEGQSTASNLCILSELIDNLDDAALELITEVAPFAHVEHNSYHMFKWLEKVSESYPQQSCLIWQSMIRDSSPSYPADSIQNLLKNIVLAGFSVEALEIVETYLEEGKSQLHTWMKEIGVDQSSK